MAVVFVHGIGVQEHGATAAQGMRCLELALEDIRIEGIRVVDGVHVAQATAARRDAPRARLVLLDGWWDDVVALPSDPLARAWRVLAWLLRVAPVALLLSGSLALAGGMMRDEGRRRGAGPSLRRLTVDLQSVMWRCVIAPPLVVAGLAWAAATLLLGRGRSRAAVRTQQVLERVLGDAYAFARDRDAFAAMCARTHTVLAVASTMARRVVLVGHSQGAAIARAVCVETSRVDALVTVGAGTQQLGALRQLKTWHTVLGWVVVLVYPGFVLLLLALLLAEVRVVLVAWALGTLGLLEAMAGSSARSSALTEASAQLFMSLAWSPLTVLSLLLVGVAALSIAARRKVSAPPELSKPDVRLWHDVSSVLDPVCPGGARLEEGAIPTEVVNTTRPTRVVFEHTSYFDNEQVGDVIASVIEDVGVRRIARRTVAATSRRQRLLLAFPGWGLPITLVLSALALLAWWRALVTLTGPW